MALEEQPTSPMTPFEDRTDRFPSSVATDSEPTQPVDAEVPTSQTIALKEADINSDQSTGLVFVDEGTGELDSEDIRDAQLAEQVFLEKRESQLADADELGAISHSSNFGTDVGDYPYDELVAAELTERLKWRTPDDSNLTKAEREARQNEMYTRLANEEPEPNAFDSGHFIPLVDADLVEPESKVFSPEELQQIELAKSVAKQLSVLAVEISGMQVAADTNKTGETISYNFETGEKFLIIETTFDHVSTYEITFVMTTDKGTERQWKRKVEIDPTDSPAVEVIQYDKTQSMANTKKIEIESDDVDSFLLSLTKLAMI